MATATELSVIIAADVSKAKGALGDLEGTFGKLGAGAMGASKVMGAGLLVGGAAVAGLAAGALKLGMEFDSAYDTIIAKTGATGNTLTGLQDAVKGVASNVATDLGSAADVVAVFGQKLDLVGKENVQALSTQILQLSQVTGIDATQAAAGATDMFARWGVTAAEQTGLLDKLFVASQQSGVGFDVLSAQVTQFAPTLQAAGYTAEGAAALIATLGKSGIDAAAIMPGMTKAMRDWTKDGKDAGVELDALFEALASGDPAAQATAMDVFGKSALAVSQAAQSGALDIGGMWKEMGEKAVDAISNTTSATEDFPEKLEKMKNKIKVALEPVGQAAMDAVSDVAALEAAIHACPRCACPCHEALARRREPEPDQP